MQTKTRQQLDAEMARVQSEVLQQVRRLVEERELGAIRRSNELINKWRASQPCNEFGSVLTIAEWEAFKAERDALLRRVEELEAQREIVQRNQAFYGDDGKFLVIVSDTFAYATADCEEVLATDLLTVRDLYRSHGWRGVTAWVAQRRGYEPLPEIAGTEEYQAVRKALAPPTSEAQG